MIAIKKANWREAAPSARYCQASGLHCGSGFGTVQLELIRKPAIRRVLSF